MTIVAQDRTLINYDYVSLVDYVILTGAGVVGVRAKYVDSEDCEILGRYKNMDAARTAMDDLADAIEDGAELFRMPMC